MNVFINICQTSISFDKCLSSRVQCIECFIAIIRYTASHLVAIRAFTCPDMTVSGKAIHTRVLTSVERCQLYRLTTIYSGSGGQIKLHLL